MKANRGQLVWAALTLCQAWVAAGKPPGKETLGMFEAWAEPDSVRPGQTIEYEITVTGPAARGVTDAPDVSRLERLPIGLRVERRPDRETDEPPSHTFVYHLRPTRAGAATLPP